MIEVAGEGKNRRFLALGCAALVASLTFIVHRPALDAEALSFDDYQYLVNNPLVSSPNWKSVGRFLSEILNPSTVGGYYQPLSMISLMADVALGGSPQDLRPFHRTSLLLHSANVFLVVLLLNELFQHFLPAALAGLIFGLHPLTVEAIPWIGERKTLLASFFAILSVIAYVRFARFDRMPQGIVPRGPTGFAIPASNRGRWWWYAISVLAFVFALLSKPTTTPLPAALILLDVWPLRRFRWRLLAEKAPFFLIAGVSAVVTYVSQAASYVQTPSEVGPARIPLVICHNIVFYLWKMVYPANLSSHYPFPTPMSLAHPMVLAGVVGSACLITLLLAAARRTKAPLVGWLIFFVMIFPTLGVIGFTIVIASDKYAYLPSIGLLMVVCAGMKAILEGGASKGLHRRGRVAGVVAVVLIVSGLEIRATRNYLECWRTTERLYGHMLELAPRAATLHFGMGFCHESRGRRAEARRAYEEAVQLDPRMVHARNNLGLLLCEEGQFAEAIGQFEAVLRLTPTAADVQSNLGFALASIGRPEEAMRACREALRLKPGYVPAINNWGMALAQAGDVAGAIGKFEEALALDEKFDDARRNLAAALWRQGRPAEAEGQYRELVRRHPEDVDGLQNLGRLLLVGGRASQARDCFQAALRIRPGDAGIRDLLGEAERRMQPASGPGS